MDNTKQLIHEKIIQVKQIKIDLNSESINNLRLIEDAQNYFYALETWRKELISHLNTTKDYPSETITHLRDNAIRLQEIGSTIDALFGSIINAYLDEQRIKSSTIQSLNTNLTLIIDLLQTLEIDINIKGSLSSTLEPTYSNSSNIDFVLVTALSEERDAVLAKLPEYNKLRPSANDIRTYYRSELPIAFSDGSIGSYNIIVMTLLGMGRVEAAIATADAIREWNPRYIMLIGIAGGMATNKIALGDLVISDQVVDYELQKITGKDTEIRWNVHRADPRLLDACNNFLEESWIKDMSCVRPNSGKHRRHLGPIASGDKVIAFSKILAKYQRTWPKLIGVEMEAAGVATAVFQSSKRPGFFMVRGISDLADENKGSPDVEQWRHYACDIAATFAIAFLKSGPIGISRGND